MVASNWVSLTGEASNSFNCYKRGRITHALPILIAERNKRSCNSENTNSIFSQAHADPFVLLIIKQVGILTL